MTRLLLVALPLALTACPGPGPAPDAGASPTEDAGPGPDAGDGDADAGPPPDAGDGDAGPLAPTRNDARDVLFTALVVDVATRAAQATITLAATDQPGASFEVGDLTIEAVTFAGADLPFLVEDARLDLALPPTAADPVVVIDYTYEVHNAYDGALASGVTLTWPYYCGNLFPCRSAPADGTAWSLTLSGVPDDQTAVYAATLDVEAPAYQVAWAVGPYTEYDLGETTAGTQVYAWALPGSEADTQAGTASLRDYVDWLEQKLGPYPFGDAVGSVEADWGVGALGGMEHHPFWHVAKGAMDAADVHAHEAAHGWFGDGIRVACWEDFVLSEGTVSYLTARAIEAVDGQAAAGALWADYEGRLNYAQVTALEKVAWPPGCDSIDILDYFSSIPYMKGAYFYRALEQAIGRDDLDDALATAFDRHALEALTMQALLDIIEEVSGFDPNPCAALWLQQEALPADLDAPCAE